MATYTKRSCSKCGATVQGWQRQYLEFGPPFTTCPKCKVFVDQSDQVNEWFLMDWFRKLEYLIAAGVTGGMVGAGAGMLIMILLGAAGILPKHMLRNDIGTAIAVGAVAGVLTFYGLFYRRISESVTRSRDIKYIEQLRALNYRGQFDRDNFIVKSAFGFFLIIMAIWAWS